MNIDEFLLNEHISCVSSLNKALCDEYKNPNGTSWSNIINQDGGGYYIPFMDDYDLTVEGIANDELLGTRKETDKEVGLPISIMFKYLEQCRIHGYVRHLAEKQYTSITNNNPPPHTVDVITESCLWFDFDILQYNDRRFSDISFISLIQQISIIVVELIEFDDADLIFHAVIMRKDELQPKVTKTGEHIMKESFHLRIYLSFSKEAKKYIYHKILDNNILTHCFRGHELCNSFEDILDIGSIRNTAMFLGSAKKNQTVAHKFYKLYEISTYVNSNMAPAVREIRDFDPIPVPDKYKTDKNGRKTGGIITFKDRYDYNLCYETSLCYEAPNGLIKKPAYMIKQKYQSEIMIQSEHMDNNFIEKWEIEDNKSDVYNLYVTNFQASYIGKILGLLNPERSSNYHSWFKIISILARTNEDFKPLAIYFTQRCARKWYKRGVHNIDLIWDKAVDDNKYQNDDIKTLKINTLYYWAKIDNPVSYEILKKSNAFEKIRHHAYEFSGVLNDTIIATALYSMFGTKFKVDLLQGTRGVIPVWYEFKMPGDDLGYNDTIYKWCVEGSRPDTLISYINKKFPKYLLEISDYCSEKIKDYKEQAETDEIKDLIKYNIKVRSGINTWRNNLGNFAKAKSIMNQSEIEFRSRGFINELDSNPNYIGVKNGVLQLRPTVKLIDRYHEIPISRCMGVDYIPIDFDNPFVIEMWDALKMIYVEDEIFRYKMMVTAFCLDGHRPPAMLMINIGGGGNGKSFEEQMKENVFGTVDKNGYYTSLNPGFLTKDRNSGGGPDAEMSSLESVRNLSFNELEPGAILHMSMVKYITGETISCNDKFKSQMTFSTFFIASLGSNYLPEIIGNDYGTWRRIKKYTYKMKFVDNPEEGNIYEAKKNNDCMNVWPFDINYKRAYFSILVYFYEILQNEYDGDLEKVPHQVIIDETMDYQINQDVLTRFISDKYEECDTQDKFGINAISQQFIAWRKLNIGGTTNRISIPQTMKDIEEHNIFRKNWEVMNGRKVLVGFRLRTDESYDSPETKTNELDLDAELAF